MLRHGRMDLVQFMATSVVTISWTRTTHCVFLERENVVSYLRLSFV